MGLTRAGNCASVLSHRGPELSAVARSQRVCLTYQAFRDTGSFVVELKRPLPDFADPPVIETVLGMQFAPLAEFSIPYLGLYWAKIRSFYPRCEIQPALVPAFEEFETQRTGSPVGIELVSEPTVRCWFIDQSSTRLIQVQKDRFIQNWRKVKGDEVYPRYSRLKPEFRSAWQRFCEFLEEEKLETPDVNQCEVTYVNHIELGKGWRSYGEIQKVVAYWSGTSSGDFLPEPEIVHLNTTYVIPNKRGRLYITMQPAIRQQDAKEVLQLNLTVRGRPSSSQLEDILEWFDLGHEWIVRGFTDFTTKEMHRVWGRKA